MAKRKKKVWALFEDTMCQGTIPVGTTWDEDDNTSWLTFKTEREAQLEIVDDIEIYIQQFKEKLCDFEQIRSVTMFAAPAWLNPDGSLTSEFGTHYVKDCT